jgi:hypothetical protein
MYYLLYQWFKEFISLTVPLLRNGYFAWNLKLNEVVCDRFHVQIMQVGGKCFWWEEGDEKQVINL